MIKPVDLQVMVPKTTELARIQGSESERQLLMAQRGAESTRSMVEADTREVHAKKNVQQVTLREKREPDGGAGRGGKKRRGARGGGEDGRGGDRDGSGVDGVAGHGGSGGRDGGHIDIRL